MTKDSERFQLFGICRIVLIGLLVFTHPTVWAEDGAQGKEIHIYIERQVLIAQEDGEEIYNFDIVTGRDGKETTAGTYEIFRKHEKYTSQAYGAEMPYAMFFSEDGKAIHGTQMATLRSYLHTYITGSVGSHGCVGLTDDNALALFEWAPMGTPVIVISEYEADAEEDAGE
jgi:lipoprotein-anchoring transpeptidase ErfK/SrfK